MSLWPCTKPSARWSYKGFPGDCSIWINPIMLCTECIFVVTLHNQWFKLWSYLHNTYSWCLFWSKFRYLTLQRYHVKGYSLLLCINFEEFTSCFVINVFLWLLCIFKWFKLWRIWRNTNIWGIFLVKMWVFDLRGDHIKGYPYCLAINFEQIRSCFVLNVFCD